jgi:hypothetical protein
MVPALADVVLSFYIGASQTRPSDLHVVQASRSNDVMMHDVTWHGYPFRFEIYYGIRLTYIDPHRPWTQFAMDYTHFKVYADTADRVAQTGTWHGAPLNVDAPLRERVQSIEMTHGLNMLGFSVLERIGGARAGAVYAGGGPVMFVPHAESRVDGMPHETGYDYGGSGFQLTAGAQTCANGHALFTEVKYSNGAPILRIAQGSAQTAVHTVHELAGVQFTHCR